MNKICCARLAFDIAGGLKTNTRTRKERRIRRAAPAGGVIWTYEDDDGAWKPLPGPASDHI